jgi:hypothetical protein
MIETYDDLKECERMSEMKNCIFKDLYEKEFEKVADVKFPDQVRKQVPAFLR